MRRCGVALYTYVSFFFIIIFSSSFLLCASLSLSLSLSLSRCRRSSHFQISPVHKSSSNEAEIGADDSGDSLAGYLDGVLHLLAPPNSGETAPEKLKRAQDLAPHNPRTRIAELFFGKVLVSDLYKSPKIAGLD
jgi:hypothetical protein